MKVNLECALVASLLLTSTSANAQVGSAPRPANNPGLWIASDDYPAEAIRYGMFGRVGFRIVVGVTGIPRSCAVTATSGFASLDDATCRTLVREAKFFPATDESGKPVEGIFSSRIGWQLPDTVGLAERSVVGGTVPTNVSYEMIVEPDGKISSCKPEARVNENAEEQLCAKRRQVAPVLNDSGTPVRVRITYRRSIEVIQVQ